MAALGTIRKRGVILVCIISFGLFAFIAEEAFRSCDSAKNNERQQIGEVLGEKISVQDFQKLVDEYSEVIKMQQGQENLPEEQMNQVKDMVWNTYIQNQILGRALLESITFMDGKCIFSAVRKKDMEFYGVDSKDMDGIIDQLRLTRGVEVAIFLYQSGAQEFKVSMRSQKLVDVSRIAAFFGGGGHVRAAGCTMSGSIHDVINNLSQHIAKQLDQEPAEQN